MGADSQRDKFAVVHRWLLLALACGGLFLALTAIYATGRLDMATLVVERWLIGRPLTQFDCVLVEWGEFGSAPANLVFIAAVGAACGLTRYRWRVLPALIVLVLLGMAAEALGKQLIALPLPLTMRSGMTDLSCPQAGQSHLQQFQFALGMWWEAPLPSRNVQDWSHTVSQMSILTGAGSLEQNLSYPSGHAIRWWFSGLLLAWLFWRHIKRGALRFLLVGGTVALCAGGAAIQFYVGNHLITDTAAGYLLGTALAGLAVALLLLNERAGDPGWRRGALPGSPGEMRSRMAQAAEDPVERL